MMYRARVFAFSVEILSRLHLAVDLFDPLDGQCPHQWVGDVLRVGVGEQGEAGTFGGHQAVHVEQEATTLESELSVFNKLLEFGFGRRLVLQSECGLQVSHHSLSDRECFLAAALPQCSLDLERQVVGAAAGYSFDVVVVKERSECVA